MAIVCINNSELRCMRVRKFGVIPGVTLQKRVIGINIGILKENFLQLQENSTR